MRVLACTAIIVIAASAVASARAETLVVGVESVQYYPHYEERNGEYAGLGRALLDAFAKSAGLALAYRPMPVARLFGEFAAGNVDLKYPDNAYWSADAKKGKAVVYSDPVVDYVDGVVVPTAMLGKGAAAVSKLGTVRGFTAWSWLDRIKSGTVALEENSNLAGLLQQAIAGRVDGAYANIDVVAYLLQAELKSPGALVFDPGLPHTKGHYHLSSIKRPDVIARFNAWMKTDAAEIAAIKNRFGIGAGRTS